MSTSVSPPRPEAAAFIRASGQNRHRRCQLCQAMCNTHLRATCQQGHIIATCHPAQATIQSPRSNRCLAHPTQPGCCRTGRRAACRKLQASIQYSSSNRCLAQQAQLRLQQTMCSTGRRATCHKLQAHNPVIQQQSLLGTVSPTKPAMSSSAQHINASYMPLPSSQKPLVQPSLLSTKRPTDIQTTSAVSSSVQAMFTLPTAIESCRPYTMQQSRVGTARPMRTLPAFPGNVQYMQMQPAGARSYHPFAGQYFACVR